MDVPVGMASRFIIRWAGEFLLWCFLINSLFFYTYPHRFPNIGGFLPLTVIFACGLISLYLWFFVNGGAAKDLRHNHVRLEKPALLTGMHLFLTALVTGSYCLMKRESFLSGEIFLSMGLSKAQIGTVLSYALTAMTVFGLFLLALSIWRAIRVSVISFTLACHSLLFLCVVFLTKGLFKQMLFTMEEVVRAQTQHIMVYFGMLLVYAVIFFIYFAKTKRTSRTPCVRKI